MENLENVLENLIEKIKKYDELVNSGRIIVIPQGTIAIWTIDNDKVKSIPLVDLFLTRKQAEQALKNNA